MDIGTLAQWAGATATFCAVLAALFKDEIVRRWRRPVLKATIALHAPDCNKTPFFVTRGTVEHGTLYQKVFTFDCFYFRLWIENTGNLRAERVQVYVAKLLKKNADGVFREVRTFTPMNLRWAHGDPNRPEIFADINPLMGKHCDLGRIVDPIGDCDRLPNVPKEKTILHLDLEIEPGSGGHLLPPANYQLHLRIGAANVAPAEKTIEIALEGSWFADEGKMFTDGVGIRELT